MRYCEMASIPSIPFPTNDFVRVIPTQTHCSDIVSDIPSGSKYIGDIFGQSDILSGIYLELAVEVWQCPLNPTDIRNSQLRSEAARGGREEGEE